MVSAWACQAGLTFQNEVLVAHGPRKKSYHIIMRTFDGDGKEVLVKDFGTCKTIAMRVDSILGDDVRVERVDGNRDESKMPTTSFIDLSIYTKDRPLRLVASSKITSPERALVPFGPKKSAERSADLRSMIKRTLVVPSIDEEVNTVKYIEITEDTATSKSIPAGNPRAKCSSQSAAVSSNDDLPLLDHGRGKAFSHLFGRKISHPFDRLLPWVRDLASQLPGSKQNGPVVVDARYERSQQEAYVHFTISRNFASHCHFIGRPHLQNNIMVSIDLMSNTAYQRCWDCQCRDPRRSKRKARQVLSTSPPDGIVPSMEDALKFELKVGMPSS